MPAADRQHAATARTQLFGGSFCSRPVAALASLSIRAAAVRGQGGSVGCGCDCWTAAVGPAVGKVGGSLCCWCCQSQSNWKPRVPTVLRRPCDVTPSTTSRLQLRCRVVVGFDWLLLLLLTFDWLLLLLTFLAEDLSLWVHKEALCCTCQQVAELTQASIHACLATSKQLLSCCTHPNSCPAYGHPAGSPPSMAHADYPDAKLDQ